MTAGELFERHRPRLEQAREACRTRAAWSPFADQPAAYPDFQVARAAGEAAFKALLGQRYALALPAAQDWVGEEVSPYTQQLLGISYPRCNLDASF